VQDVLKKLLSQRGALLTHLHVM